MYFYLGLFMIKYNIVCVGNLKEKFSRECQEEYMKRLSRFANVNIIELTERNNLNDVNSIILKESEDILNKLPKGHNILLDIKGELLSSEELSSKLEKLELFNDTINFIIGGSYGVSDLVKEKADYKISFSRMTFPHNLIRIMLLEQVYRAKTIANNMPYHK